MRDDVMYEEEKFSKFLCIKQLIKTPNEIFKDSAKINELNLVGDLPFLLLSLDAHFFR